MASGIEYRVKAAEMAAKASSEPNSEIRAQLVALERGYLRLAEQADKNARTALVYEPPLTTDKDQATRSSDIASLSDGNVIG
jgi:hypothetical protein